MFVVYKHTSPSGKVYIGITSQSPIKRWGNGSGYRKQAAFTNAINKYGWDNIKHEILYEGLTREEAEQKEIALIRQYRSNEKEYGYNIDNGGNCSGTHSEETRKKISEGNKGKTYSEETLKRMSLSHKGKQIGADNPFYGKHHTDSVKQKHSSFMRGNNYFKGKHHTEEYKKQKSKQMSELYANGIHPRSKRVIGNGIEYRSLREAARQTQIGLATLFKWVNDDERKEWGYI